MKVTVIQIVVSELRMVPKSLQKKKELKIAVGALGTIPKSLLRGLEELEIGVRAENFQIRGLLRSASDMSRPPVTQTPVKDD